MDGRPWEYENWTPHVDQYCSACKCVLDYTKNGHAWYATKCDNPFHEGNFPFVCAVPPRMMSGNHTLILDKASLGFQILHFWWSHELESKVIHLKELRSVGRSKTKAQLTWKSGEIIRHLGKEVQIQLCYRYKLK